MSTINATLEWDGVWTLNEEDIQKGIPDKKGITKRSSSHAQKTHILGLR